jgi:hypothetical protein
MWPGGGLSSANRLMTILKSVTAILFNLSGLSSDRSIDKKV